jgi:hypothetical protein
VFVFSFVRKCSAKLPNTIGPALYWHFLTRIRTELDDSLTQSQKASWRVAKILIFLHLHLHFFLCLSTKKANFPSGSEGKFALRRHLPSEFKRVLRLVRVRTYFEVILFNDLILTPNVMQAAWKPSDGQFSNISAY